MSQINDFFKLMVAKEASDLHLSSGSSPYLRVHGEIQKMDHAALTGETIQNLVFEILTEKQKKLFIEKWELDCSYAVKGLGRFRCNIFMQRRGMSAVFRLIPEKIKTFEELELPKTLSKLMTARNGLVLLLGRQALVNNTLAAILIK